MGYNETNPFAKRNLIMKKFVLFVVFPPATYLAYAFVRGVLYGVKNPNATPEQVIEKSVKIATFRG